MIQSDHFYESGTNMPIHFQLVTLEIGRKIALELLIKSKVQYTKHTIKQKSRQANEGQKNSSS